MSEERWPVPSSWEWASAGDIAKIVGGGTPSSKIDGNFAEDGIPWITPADLTGYTESHISHGRRDLSERGFAGSGAQMLPAGSVLFSSRAPIGYCVIASNEVSTNQGFKSLVLNGDIDSGFIRYYLLSAKEYAESKASGTTFMELSGARVAELAVPLAPVPEQRRIVSKLDGLTGRTARARKELDRIPSLVTRYKQRLLALAFSGEITADWRRENGLQAHWAGKTVGDLITDVIGGKNLRCAERPPEKDEKGVVKVSAVTWGEFDPLASKTLPTHFQPPEKTKIRSGDFLISRANTLELVAAVVIVKDTPDNLYLSDKILRLELPEADKPWLLWFLRSPMGRSAIEARATGNQLSMRNLSQNALRNIEMPWPEAAERAEIIRRIQSAFDWIDRLAAEHTAAARLLPKLDAAILAKAFRGELVAQDPKDEPASVLLERVKTERATQGTKSKSGRGRKPNGSKALLMTTEKALPPRDRLLKDSEKWPVVGLPYEAIAMRNSMPHDTLRDALFELLSGPKPALQQRFDNDAEVMVIQRVPA